MRQHQFIMALGGTFLLMFCLDTAAQDAGPVQYGTTQEGRYGVGHDKWHRDFYATNRQPRAASVLITPSRDSRQRCTGIKRGSIYNNRCIRA